MKSVAVIVLLLYSVGGLCQADTCRKPANTSVIESLANFDFEAALKKDIAQFQKNQAQSGISIQNTKNLCGWWRGEAMGNNWGGLDQTLKKPDTRLFFTGDSVFIFRNDSLLRVTAYRLITGSSNPLRRHRTLLEWDDSKEQWKITFIQIGQHVPWHGKATKLFILLNIEPNCVCGCPELLYSQEQLF